jgi:hypothetical protein
MHYHNRSGDLVIVSLQLGTGTCREWLLVGLSICAVAGLAVSADGSQR